MKQMIIVGAGGLGRDVEDYARGDSACGTDWTLAGFLDTRPDALDRFGMSSRVLGDPRTWVPKESEDFIVAVGDTKLRRELVAPLIAKGANFVSLCTNVRFGARCRYGRSVFADRATLSADVTIGDYSFVGADTIIGHDSYVGDYVQIGPRVFIAGRVKVGDGATIHPMATISMDVSIGAGAVVAAGAVVFGNVPAGITVIGNPARKFSFKQ